MNVSLLTLVQLNCVSFNTFKFSVLFTGVVSFSNGPIADEHQSYSRLRVADWAFDCDAMTTTCLDWLKLSDVSYH